MSIKEHLHRLVDELPDEEVPEAERILTSLAAKEPESFMEFLKRAPIDDEPTTPEEDEGAAEAWQEYLRGESIPWEEFIRTMNCRSRTSISIRANRG